jgi:hypothetical protein
MKLSMKHFFSVLTLLCTTAYSQEVWHQGKIHSVYPLGDGSAAILFVIDSTQCTNTSTPNKYYHLTIGANGVTAAGFKNMYSTVLVAAATGKEIAIAFNSGTSSCDINRLIARF